MTDNSKVLPIEEIQLRSVNGIDGNKKGGFIPYIGDKYFNGIDFSGMGKAKVLVIGPRHYCDAGYSSRNFLAYLSEEERKKIYTDKDDASKYTIKKLEVGCRKHSPNSCLDKEVNGNFKCPVIVNSICPIIEDTNCCKIRIGKTGTNDDGINCSGMRQLRCETLYAIHEYIGKPKMESARYGITYFDSITKFIQTQHNSSNREKSFLWERIAFINLIQRYIPLKDMYESKDIERQIKKEDIVFAKQMIDYLNPDIIITTMECVKNKLNGILKDAFINSEADFINFHLFINKERENDFINHLDGILDIVFTKIENSNRLIIANIQKKTQFGGYINGMIEAIKDSGFINNEKIIRDELLERIIDQIDEMKAKYPDPNNPCPIPEKIQTLKGLNRLNKNYQDLFRKWLANNKSDKTRGRVFMKEIIGEYKKRLGVSDKL